MTKPMMDLRALVEKSDDADRLREMIGFAAERLMELEIGTKTGADYGEKCSERLAQRNGYLYRQTPASSDAVSTSSAMPLAMPARTAAGWSRPSSPPPSPSQTTPRLSGGWWRIRCDPSCRSKIVSQKI